MILGKPHRYKESILAIARNEDGRCHVTLYKEGIGKNFYIHKLVAIYFLPDANNDLSVLHKNGDNGDNRVDNLYWGTLSENMYDRVKHGVHHESNKTNCPRGHLLQKPNLKNAALKMGRRECLACSKTQNKYNNSKKRKGIIIKQELFQEISDEHYSQILLTKD